MAAVLGSSLLLMESQHVRFAQLLVHSLAADPATSSPQTSLQSSVDSSSTPAQGQVVPQPSERRPRAADLDRDCNDQALPMRDRMAAFVKGLQVRIVDSLTSLDPSTEFVRDHWTREAGGEGISCVLQDGQVFEKAGVNVSVVHGKLPPAAIKQMRARMEEDQFGWWDGVTHLPFFACGLSLVVHPVNPKAPTVHLNYRYFEVENPHSDAKIDGPSVWWFGGGTDLTPSYLFPEDARHFHVTMKDACDEHDPAYYPRFKQWCDDYFYIPHRKERRGIGGIFFDDLTGDLAQKVGSAGRAKSREELFAFVRTAGDAFLPAYMPIIERRQWMRYSDHEKRWQQLRRGRYGGWPMLSINPRAADDARCGGQSSSTSCTTGAPNLDSRLRPPGSRAS